MAKVGRGGWRLAVGSFGIAVLWGIASVGCGGGGGAGNRNDAGPRGGNGAGTGAEAARGEPGRTAARGVALVEAPRPTDPPRERLRARPAWGTPVRPADSRVSPVARTSARILRSFATSKHTSARPVAVPGNLVVRPIRRARILGSVRTASFSDALAPVTPELPPAPSVALPASSAARPGRPVRRARSVPPATSINIAPLAAVPDSRAATEIRAPQTDAASSAAAWPRARRARSRTAGTGPARGEAAAAGGSASRVARRRTRIPPRHWGNVPTR